ncbi:MAG: TIGR01841 family phasin [Burkholderiales bacterium]|nr:TIGR01841 family phasin [Burkholderiales bacterium]
MFNQNNEQFTEATNNTVNVACGFFQTSLDSIEKLTKIQLESSKKILDDASQTIKDISVATNPKELFDKVNKLATNTIESNICNYRNAYEIFANSQSKLGQLFETYFQTAQENVNITVDAMAQFNPAKNNFATDSIKTFVANTTQAFDAFNKASSQVAQFANSNIQAAVATTANAVQKATPPASSVTK